VAAAVSTEAARASTFFRADALRPASPHWWSAKSPLRYRATGLLAATVIIVESGPSPAFGFHLRQTAGMRGCGDVVRFARLMVSVLEFVALLHVRLPMAHFCYLA